MKQGNYHIVFKTAVFHSYFENGKCNCVLIKPMPTTMNLFKRFNFLFKNTVNGFELYSNSTQVVDLLAYMTKNTGSSTFSFELFTDNTHFSYFTDLPMDWMGQLAYDTQREFNIKEKDNVTLVPKLTAAPHQPILGTLQVHFKDLSTTPANFVIKYAARTTQWQYFIINKSAVTLDNPKVIGKSDIQFTGPESVTIETGEQALLFSSDQNLIPLHIKPVHKFDLVDALVYADSAAESKNRRIKTIIKGLPTPKAEWLGLVKSDAKLVSSPMYVYI